MNRTSTTALLEPATPTPAANFAVATLDVGDSDVDGPLTPKQEKFALAFVHLNNAAAAYRVAYDVRPATLPNTVKRCGYALAHNPKIQARVRAIKAEMAQGTIADLRELAQMYYDIATADTNEVIRWVHTCCRHCYGVGHAYQWKDAAEFTDAYLKVSDAITDATAERDAAKTNMGRRAAIKLLEGLRMPLFDGGEGYDKRLDPVLTCPECCGKGVETHELADTTKLTGKAALLYEGLKITQHGIEVKLADKGAAREALGRMMGAFKDADPRKFNGADIEGEADERLPDNISAEDAARSYLQLMG